MSFNPQVDYITVNAAVPKGRYNVVIMTYDRAHDEMTVFRCSEQLSIHAAEALAKSWAAATSLTILPGPDNPHGGGT